jgi:outer membrane receptor protein involved in Fe transport
LEFNYLRLDQTGVEYPGMAFDMDFLVTDGFELGYIAENQTYCDRLAVDAWYNRTRFEGNAQREGKRRQFPFLDFIRYVGFTDVDSASSGFRAAMTWGEQSDHLTVGADLRYLKQELNEISSGRIGFTIWEDANSPIPRSQYTNPGIFLERVIPVNERLVVTAGARVDFIATQVIDDPEKLAHLGNWPDGLQSSLADILGTDEFNRDFAVWSAYLSGNYELSPNWNLVTAFGHGERPPSLTEFYVAQSFLFLLQNGLNTATGDPRLHPERLWQIDLGLKCNYDRFRAGVNGYHAWIHDYITFENIGVVRGPPFGQVEQVNLKYVNTDRVTFVGFELYGEYDWSSRLTPFVTLKHVEGQDHTRDGDFATQPATPGSPSVRVPGLPRGSFSGIAGPSSEPLPSILPLESRLGIRLHPSCRQPPWSVELSARVVADQYRVAASLLETPTPGFTVWDLRGYWRVRDGLLLVAGVENFTDNNYREHLDYRSASGIQVFQPGVNFYFGTELTY